MPNKIVWDKVWGQSEYLYTFGCFCNYRELSGADWLDPLIATSFHLQGILNYGTKYICSNDTFTRSLTSPASFNLRKIIPIKVKNKKTSYTSVQKFAISTRDMS